MSNSTQNLNIAITGSGGSGVITAGTMLLEAAAKSGLYGLFTRSSGPQIRGGEAAALLRLSSRPVSTPGDVLDILVSIDWHNIERFAIELPLGSSSLVLADPSLGDVPEIIRASGARIVDFPLKEFAKKVNKGRQNMVALGAIAALIDLPEDILDSVMVSALKKRGEEALIASREAAAAGHEAASSISFLKSFTYAQDENHDRWMISGNEAAGLGAMRGGIRFVAAYPITPATELLEWMAPNLKKVGGALVQAEDELASINMIIGASYGGTPSLTATSGPGLALMTESIGLAVAAEIPLVIVNVMRGGPSTGIPTKSEQSDLNIALFGLHGDAPHLVLAPTSVRDCVFTTQWAVSLAEATQTPTIVLSDQLIGQAKSIIDPPADLAFVSKRLTLDDVTADVDAESFKRYATGETSVSPMSIPGTRGGQYTADGLEHDPSGLPSSQVSDHKEQLDKRSNKLEKYDYGDHWAETQGKGPLAIITWGSTSAAVKEALDELREEGIDIKLVAPRLLSPALPNRMDEALDGVEHALVIELSHSKQFYRYLRGYFDFSCDLSSHNRAGPLPYRVAELKAVIKEWSGI